MAGAVPALAPVAPGREATVGVGTPGSGAEAMVAGAGAERAAAPLPAAAANANANANANAIPTEPGTPGSGPTGTPAGTFALQGSAGAAGLAVMRGRTDPVRAHAFAQGALVALLIAAILVAAAAAMALLGRTARTATAAGAGATLPPSTSPPPSGDPTPEWASAALGLAALSAGAGTAAVAANEAMHAAVPPRIYWKPTPATEAENLVVAEHPLAMPTVRVQLHPVATAAVSAELSTTVAPIVLPITRLQLKYTRDRGDATGRSIPPAGGAGRGTHGG